MIARGLQLLGSQTELLWPLLFPGPLKAYEQEPNFIRKYKTELCKNWESGHCRFGAACTFAHGEFELRQKPPTNKRLKLKRRTEENKKRLPVFEEIEAKGACLV